jgi:hypothetical protein
MLFWVPLGAHVPPKSQLGVRTVAVRTNGFEQKLRCPLFHSGPLGPYRKAEKVVNATPKSNSANNQAVKHD